MQSHFLIIRKQNDRGFSKNLSQGFFVERIVVYFEKIQILNNVKLRIITYAVSTVTRDILKNLWGDIISGFG